MWRRDAVHGPQIFLVVLFFLFVCLVSANSMAFSFLKEKHYVHGLDCINTHVPMNRSGIGTEIQLDRYQGCNLYSVFEKIKKGSVGKAWLQQKKLIQEHGGLYINWKKNSRISNKDECININCFFKYKINIGGLNNDKYIFWWLDNKIFYDNLIDFPYNKIKFIHDYVTFIFINRIFS